MISHMRNKYGYKNWINFLTDFNNFSKKHQDLLSNSHYLVVVSLGSTKFAEKQQSL